METKGLANHKHGTLSIMLHEKLQKTKGINTQGNQGEVGANDHDT